MGALSFPFLQQERFFCVYNWAHTCTWFGRFWLESMGQEVLSNLTLQAAKVPVVSVWKHVGCSMSIAALCSRVTPNLYTILLPDSDQWFLSVWFVSAVGTWRIVLISTWECFLTHKISCSGGNHLTDFAWIDNQVEQKYEHSKCWHQKLCTSVKRK